MPWKRPKWASSRSARWPGGPRESLGRSVAKSWERRDWVGCRVLSCVVLRRKRTVRRSASWRLARGARLWMFLAAQRTWGRGTTRKHLEDGLRTKEARLCQASVGLSEYEPDARVKGTCNEEEVRGQGGDGRAARVKRREEKRKGKRERGSTNHNTFDRASCQ